MVFASSLKLFPESFRSSVVSIHSSCSLSGFLFLPLTERTRQFFLSYMKNTDEVVCFGAITNIWPMSLFDCSSYSLKNELLPTHTSVKS